MENSTVPSCCFVTTTMFIVVLVVDIVLFVAITIGNTLVILSVVNYHHMRTNTNFFLASLAVADLFVAAICLPTVVLLQLCLIPTISPWVCITGSMMSIVTFSVSFNHLAVVAYDRFLAITKPLKYCQKMTSRRLALLITASWSTSIVFGLLPFFGWNNIDSYSLCYCDLLFVQAFSYRCTAVVVVACIPINVLVYAYFKIFRVARQHHRRIADERMVFHRPGEPNLARDLKAAKTLAVVLGTFFTAVTPAAFVSIADAFFPVRDLFLCEVIVFHILYGNSAVNPVIYAFRSKEFRFAFIRLLSKIFRCKRWQDMAKRTNQSLVHDKTGVAMCGNMQEISEIDTRKAVSSPAYKL